MMVAAVDQGHAHRGAGKLAGRIQTAKTAAQDHDVLRQRARRGIRDHVLDFAFLGTTSSDVGSMQPPG